MTGYCNDFSRSASDSYVMAYRSDRDGINLIRNVNFVFDNQIRLPSADSIRASRLHACTNRPDIRLHPYQLPHVKISLFSGRRPYKRSLAAD
jgi:hypothetical protein